MSASFDFDKIVQGVDKAVAAIEHLETSMAATAKNATTFNRAFGSTAQLNKFIDSISKIDKISATNFKTVSNGLIGLAKALSALPPTNSLTGLLNDITRFQKGIAGFTMLDPKQLDLVFDSVTAIFSRISTIPPLPPDLSKSFTSLSGFIRAINAIINTLPSPDADARILEFIQHVQDIIDLANGLPTLNDGISKTIRALTSASQLISRINRDAGLNIDVGILKFVQNISDIIQLMNATPTITDDVKNSIAIIGNAIRDLTKINTDSLTAGIDVRILQFFDSLKSTFDIANSLPVVNDTVKTSVSAIGAAIRLIVKLGTDPLPADIDVKILQVFDKIGDMISHVNALPPIAKDPQQALSVIGTAARSLGKITGVDLPPQAGQRIIDTFSKLGDIINILNAVPALGTDVRQSVNAISNIISALSKIGTTAVNTTALDSFGVAINKFITDLSGSATLTKDVVDSILAITRLLNSASRFKTTDFVKPLQELAKGLGPILTAFQGFSGKFPSFTRLFTSLVNVSKLSKTAKFDVKDLKGFQTFVHEIALALNELGAVNVNGAKLTAISLALAKISDIQKNALRAGIGSGSGTPNPSSSFSIAPIAIAAGVLLGNLATKALSSIGTFIRQLGSIDQAIGRNLSQIGIKLRTFSTQLKSIGKSISDSFGLDALAKSPQFQSAETFDTLSKRVQAFGDLTQAETEQVKGFAYELSRNYPIAADLALQAVSKLIQAGENLSSIKLVLPSVADLATISGVDLPDIAQGLIVATKNFKSFTDTVPSGFENSATAANIFTGAITHSTVELTDLFDSMRSSDPTANLFGLSLAQNTAILSEFADQGLRGAIAGRQLSYLFRALASAKDTGIFAQLNQELRGKGVNDFSLSIRNADGSLKDLNKIIQDINYTLDTLNLSEDARVQIITDLTGGQAQLALAVLLANNGYQQMTDRILSVNSASSTAQKILDQLRGQVDLLGTRFTVFTTKALLPLIQKGLTPVVKAISSFVKIAGSLPDTFYEVASNAVILGSGLATLTGVILVAVSAVTLFESGLFRAAGGVIYLATHIPALILGVGGFVASLGILLVTVTLVAGAIATAGIIITSFRQAIERNIGGAGDAFNRFKASASSAFHVVSPLLNEAGRVFNLIFGSEAQGQVDSFGSRIAAFFNRLTSSFNDLKTNFLQGGALLQVFGDFVSAQSGNKTAISRLGDELTRLSRLPLIKTLFGSNATPTGLKRVFGQILKDFTRIGGAISDVFSGITGILFGEPDSLAKIKTGISHVLGVVTEVIQGATGINLLSSILAFDQGDLAGGIAALVRTGLGKIKDLILQNRGTLVDIGSTLVRLLLSPLRVLGFAEFILNALGLTNAAGVVHTINQAINDVIRAALNLGFDLLSGKPVTIDVGGFLMRVFGNIDPLAIATGIKDAVITALGSVPKLLENAGVTLNIPALTDFGVSLDNSTAFKQITDGLANLVSYPLKAATDMFNGIGDLVKAIQGGNLQAGIDLLAGIVLVAGYSGALTTLFTVIKGAFLGFALPAFGIITLVSAFKNIKDLLAGDVGGFLTNTLADVASTLLSFFGVDLSKDDIITRVGDALKSLQPIVEQTGAAILQSLQGLISGITLAIDDLQSRVDLAKETITPGSSEGFGQRFFDLSSLVDTASKAIFEPGAFDKLFAGFADKSKNLVNKSELADFGAANAKTFIDAFAYTIGNQDVNKIPKALFDNIIASMQNTGLLDQALAGIPESQKTAILARIQSEILAGATAAPFQTPVPIDAVAHANLIRGIVDQFNKEIQSELAAGATAGEAGRSAPSILSELLDKAGLSGLSPGERQKIISDIRSAANLLYPDMIAEAQGAIDSRPVMALKIPVKVQIVPTGLNGIAFGLGRAISSIFQGLAIGGGFIPGRASGGELKPYSTYGVHDTQSPEVAQFSDGRSLLFTGKASGWMSKIAGMASAPNVTNVIGAFSGDATAQDTQDTYLNDLKDLDDTAKQIAKINKQISEEQTKAFEDEADLRRKAARNEILELAKFEHDRHNIISDAHDNLLDAIRRGDGAAAFATARDAKKKLDEQAYQFQLDKTARDVALQEQIFQNGQQRDEQLKNYQDQLADLLAHQAEVQAEVDRYNKAQVDNAATVSDNVQTLFNNTKTIIGNVVNAVTGYLGDLFSTSDGFLLQAEEALGIVNGIINGIGGAVPPGSPGTPGGFRGGGGGNTTTPIPIHNNGGTGFPPNPRQGDVFRDVYQNLWSWNGSNWIIVPHHAVGGAFSSRSASILHDTSRSEIMTLNDGTSLFLSGRNSGRVTPLQPGFDPILRSGGLQRRASVYNDYRTIHLDVGGVYSNASDPLEVAEQVRERIMPEVHEALDRARSGNRSNSLMDIKQR